MAGARRNSGCYCGNYAGRLPGKLLQLLQSEDGTSETKVMALLGLCCRYLDMHACHSSTEVLSGCPAPVVLQCMQDQQLHQLYPASKQAYVEEGVHLLVCCHQQERVLLAVAHDCSHAEAIHLEG
jgi:hypothetical protein